MTTASVRAPRRSLDPAVIWAMAAAVFWLAIAALGSVMFSAVPRIAAFDLDLLVQAGRAVSAGQSPYDPAMLAGSAPDAVDLFYSYPPIVAQLLAPIAGLPLGVIAIGLAVVSVGLLTVAVLRLAELVAPDARRPAVAWGVVATAAMTLPLVIAVLFGNLDAVFPALFGFALVAALSARTRDGVIGGVAIGLAAVAKVYPAGLGLWFLVRAARATRDKNRGDRHRLLVSVVAAAATAAALVALSVAIFGLGPWQDYGTVASAAARAELVDGRNAAPAAQLALWLGAGSDTARLFHLPVAGLAAFAIVAAAWVVRDPLESLTIAAVASLLLLPVSWIHYPAALLPFGAAAVLRARALEPAGRRRVNVLSAASLVAAGAAVVWMPSLWIAMALGLLSIAASRREIEVTHRADEDQHGAAA